MTDSKVDRDLIQDVIDSMIMHGDQYKKSLKEFNEKFKVQYKIKDNVVRTYQSNNK